MNINKNNYEAFFLDYHEGNLTAEEVAVLLLFVEQHPELKEEFENFENCSIEDFSSIEFENKRSLKKEITIANQQDYFIGLIENSLNDSENKLVSDFLDQNPSAHLEFELFRKTLLKADKTIVYENKNALKKTASTIVNRTEPILTYEEDLLIASVEKVPFYYYAAAASVMLLLGLFFLNKINTSTTDLAKTTIIESTIPQKSVLVQSEKEEVNVEVNKKITEHAEKIIPVKRNTIINDNESLSGEQNKVAASLQSVEQPQAFAVRKETLNSNEDYTNKHVDYNLDKITKQEYLMEKEEFVSLHELAAERIKEKLLDENDVYEQKESGRLKKISGWDIAQIITKGISKFSGRKFELKPYYNDRGSVTSYELIAGEFKLSKGHHQ